LALDNYYHERDNRIMNWKNLIKGLLDAGMTQVQIAEACETGQSHISSLYRGDRKQPNWLLGDRLVALHAKRCKTEKMVA